MTDKVLAAVAIGTKRTELREFDIPEAAPGAGLLRVEAVGVCGTDWSWYASESQKPQVLGHHTVGRIAEIGEVASLRWGVEEGDRVALEEYIPCGHCAWCRTGEFRLCDATDPWLGGIRYGITSVSTEPSLWGGFSQYQYLHPNSVLHKMPEHVPAAEAALTLPMSNGIEWVCLEGGTTIGSTVVIQGPGQLGLACVIAAKEAGAGRIILSGVSRDARRMELARMLGATDTVDVQCEDLVERVTHITDGEMADLVIDAASGGPSTVIAATEAARKGGTVLLGGFKHATIPDFYSDQLISKRLTVKGVRGHGYDSVEMAVRLIASEKHPLNELCTHLYSLRETDEALKTLGGEGVPDAVCVTVAPWK